MALLESEQNVFAVAIASPICDIPAVRRLTPASISIRVHVFGGGFIDAFHNELTGTTAFALVQEGHRVFGADNTGGWHVHPFADPNLHEPMPGLVSFAEFVAEIEHQA